MRAEKLFSIYLLTMLVLPTDELPMTAILKTVGRDLLVNSFDILIAFFAGG